MVDEVEHQTRLLASGSNCFINNLLSEVLSVIFFILVQKESLEFEEIDDHRHHTIKYPWVLAAVCQQWRMVCLGDSCLWSFFNLWTNHGYCDGAHSIDQTYLQLERSRNAPLFVQLTPQQYCTCNNQAARFDILLSQTQRWASLTYEGSNPENDIIPRWIPDGTRFPGLCALRLQLWEYDYDYDNSELNSFSLRAFTEIGISWQCLTYLRFIYRGYDRQALMNLLFHCRNLTSLHLELLVPEIGWNDPYIGSKDETFIGSPQATGVSLASSSCETHLAIDCIPVSTLQTLHLTVCCEHSSGPSLEQVAIEIIKRFRYSSSLQVLQLALMGRGALHDNSFTELLKHCHNVRLLALAGSHQHDATTIIQNLAPSVGAPPNTWPCPRLHSLGLGRLSIDVGSLIKMVDARLQDRADTQRLCNVVWAHPDLNKVQSEHEKRLFEDAKNVLETKYNGSLLNLKIV